MPSLSRQRSLGEGRIYLLLAAVFVVMSLLAPRFLTVANLTGIAKGASLSVLPAVGFTIVMICGKLDLSIGTSLTLGGMLAVGLQPHLGWASAITLAVLAGMALGWLNGFLVAKAKVDSFIATLGTMIVTQGLVYIYGHGGTVSATDFRLGDWLEKPLLPLLTPRVVIALLMVVAFDFFLRRTTIGRGFFLIGGNASAAWNAGLPVDRYVMGAFVLSGGLSCLGGALFGASLSSAMPTMGNSSLMEVLSATIIGGTAMVGGRGSVVNSAAAIGTLEMLYNGLDYLGAGWEAHRISAGLVLGLIVLYEAVVEKQAGLRRGQRHELVAEWRLREAKKDEENNENDPDEPEGTEAMIRKDSNALPIVCVTALACTAMVVCFMLYLLHVREPALVQQASALTATATPSAGRSAAVASTEPADISMLKSTDGQPLISETQPKTVPPRPVDPAALPEDDSGHWWDMEYAGWDSQKVNSPKSPGNGPAGKSVVYLKAIDHPYLTAVISGMQMVANADHMTLRVKTANKDINIQSQQADEVINQKPDMVIISPVDAQACVPIMRKLNQAGIPVICSNLLPDRQAFPYLLAWTGPDDWGQFRKLVRDFAKRMNYQGGYCIVQHLPGSSPFFSRTWSAVTELKKIAPKMQVLAMQTTDLDSAKSKQVVSGWITRFGPQLKGVVSCDDSGAQVGINEAVKDANREDIVRVAAGNSKVGMDFLKSGELQAITYQSPEADGALPMKLAADWFSGKMLPPINYLPQAIITKDNVDHYLPAQW